MPSWPPTAKTPAKSVASPPQPSAVEARRCRVTSRLACRDEATSKPVQYGVSTTHRIPTTVMRGVVAAAAGPGRTAAGWGTGTGPPTLSQVGTLVGFFPVAIALTLTPGVATALVIRSALRGGRRAAFATTLGNSAGVLAWALAAAVGIAAIVAASVTAFTVVKIAGAVVLLVMGLHSVLAKHETPA